MPFFMPAPAGFDAEALLRRLNRNLRRTADQATPDFLRRMPDQYFRDTDEDTVLVHLSALVAARASGVAPRMVLKDADERTWTFVHEQSYRGLLADLVEQLPRDKPLTSAKVHTAIDGGLVLDVFRLGEASRFDPENERQAEKLTAILAYARGLGDEQATDELPRYIAQCSADFVLAASPIRAYETWCLARQVVKTDDVACAVYPQSDPSFVRLSVVAGNADTRALFERYVRYFGWLGFDITRAFLDVIRADDGHTVSSLGFVVKDPEATLRLDGSRWPDVRLALKRLRWVDDQVIARMSAHQDLGLIQAEVLVALTRLIHPELAKDNPFAFTRNRMRGLIDQSPTLASMVAGLLVDRFNPNGGLSAAAVSDRVDAFERQLDEEVEAQTARRFWMTLARAAVSVTRTNVHLEDRYGLALLVEPSFFASPARKASPHSVVFIHAHGTDAFHVRFERLARGGVQVQRPLASEQHVFAAERLFDDAYDFAFAQQLKNKDIPEGGAKAVVLVEPDASPDAGLKAFVDGLLDLFLPVQKEERIYLDPDDDISSDTIDWVVARAAGRGYEEPWAFMSAKPSAGADHRAYAVTSEGLAVFLEESLKTAGIDPRRQSFTVKLTGGPRSTIGGGLIRILVREFGPNVRFVGVADDTGVAWDPGGLNHAALLTLAEEALPIVAFDKPRLGPQGGVAGAEQPEGQRRRNRLAFEVVADAFVPAAGDIHAINGDNWSDFLRGGRPSSRVIVEATDRFITPDARRQLSNAGVLIFRDSTATKCGVICSSYEVAAGLLFDPGDFAPLRSKFMEQVLERLRSLARREAIRLLTDYREDASMPLPERAVSTSRAVLRATNAIAEALAEIPNGDRESIDRVVAAHLPSLLIEAAGPGFQRFPRGYLDRTIAARLAADIVYREGESFVDRVPAATLGRRCIAYYRAQQDAAVLAEAVLRSDMPDAPRIASLLEIGGARSALALFERNGGHADD